LLFRSRAVSPDPDQVNNNGKESTLALTLKPFKPFKPFFWYTYCKNILVVESLIEDVDR